MKFANGYKALSLAVIAGLATTTAQAAGLDRSGQDITAFLQDGTYAETVYTYVDTDVSGHGNAGTTTQYARGNATGNMTNSYDFFRFGVKGDVNDRISVGVLYDEPFGASIAHQEGAVSDFVSQGGDSAVAALTGGRVPSTAIATASLAQLQAGFGALQQIQAGLTQVQSMIAAAQAANNAAQVAALQAQAASLQATAAAISTQITTATNTTSLPEAQAAAQRLGGALNIAGTAEAQKGQGTSVDIRTNNLTGLVGVKLGENRNFQVYAGPAAQRLKGEVHLRGTAYQQATGYDAKISPDTQIGWVAGVSYAKPEIALKAALTYRSAIEHDTDIAEVFPALGATNGVKTQNFKVTLPESYNFDFQTGVNPTTLLTAKVRYVPWGKFDIQPTLFTQTSSLPIISYSKDQWSGELGLGKKINDKLSLAGNIGYDSGAGNPATSLGPIKGYYSVGLGAKYNVTPEWSVSLGGKYLKFGDADAALSSGVKVGEFEKNDGYIAGLKLAYQAK